MLMGVYWLQFKEESGGMTAIILAAGFSKRFGGHKLLAEIEGKPIVQHVMEAVENSGFDEIILVSRSSAVKKLAEGRSIKVVHNSDAAKGISSSVKCGISNAKPTDAFMFFNGDQPFIDGEAVNRLKEAFAKGKGSIIVPQYNGENGNPVIFAAEWREMLGKTMGDIGGRTIIKTNPDKVCYVEIENTKAGMDIDTKEDYDAHERNNLPLHRT